MNTKASITSWVVWGALALIAVAITGSFILGEVAKRRLALDKPLLDLGRVADFSLTNQLGKEVTRADLEGSIWVADIIFTRCPGPCVQMTRRMQELQEALPKDIPVRLISLTTDPEYDSPEVLQRYAQRFGAESDRWWFLTGAKETVVRLAVDGLKLVMMEKEEERRESVNDLFIHSTLLVVVDGKGHVRATFESVPRADLISTAAEDGVEEEEGNFAETKSEIVNAVRRLSWEL